MKKDEEQRTRKKQIRTFDQRSEEIARKRGEEREKSRGDRTEKEGQIEMRRRLGKRRKE